jgi:hypothetical protein
MNSEICNDVEKANPGRSHLDFKVSKKSLLRGAATSKCEKFLNLNLSTRKPKLFVRLEPED